MTSQATRLSTPQHGQIDLEMLQYERIIKKLFLETHPFSGCYCGSGNCWLHFKSGEYIRSNGVMSAGVFGKDKESYLVKTDRITSGPITINNAAVITNNFEDVMTLGAGYLQNFLVTIDYPRDVLYLKPYGDRHPESEFLSYGFGISKEQAKTIVTGVWKGSAADKAGLSVGDELVAVDGKEATGISFFAFMQLMKSTDSMTISYINKIQVEHYC